MVVSAKPSEKVLILSATFVAVPSILIKLNG
jgi:hypothetical protein